MSTKAEEFVESRRVLKFLIRIFFFLTYKVEIINVCNVPETGAAILCANHIGSLDMFFIGYKIKRLVHYMAKKELFDNPIRAPFLRWLGAFPVKRGSSDVRSIKTAMRLLQDGHILGIFPQGTRVPKADIKNTPVKPGVALFAIKSGAPVLPVAIDRKNRRPFTKVKIIFGEPFYLKADSKVFYTSKELRDISCDIMERIYKLKQG